MNKNIGVYSIIWAICLAVFNVIVFVSPNAFSGSFWVGYIFITVAFFVQLACAFIAFQAKNPKKLFYNLSFISISYGGLVAMLLAGSVFMAIPMLPEWLGIIVCVIILAFNVIAIIKATVSANIVNGIDEKVKAQTLFMNALTRDAQNLISSARSDALCAQAKKVYEAIRYSDPVANDALSNLDDQIKRQFTSFADAVRSEDIELAKESASVLIELVEKRNRNCKLIKNN